MPDPASTDVELKIESDGLVLPGGAAAPVARPKGVVVLLHGIPSIAPSEPGDEGYPGFARELARRGWIASWAELRAAKSAPGFFSIAGWVRDATALLDATRQLDHAQELPAAFVASSAGGAVAAAAARSGAKVAAIAMLGTPADWATFASDPRAGVERIMTQTGMALAPDVLLDPEAWAAEFEDVATTSSVADLDVPILVVHGTEDLVVPVGHAQMIAAAAPRAEVRILEGAPHQLRRVPGVVAMIDEWLTREIIRR